MMNGCEGSLKANLQHMEALSTTEEGYMMKERWLKGLLTESGYELRLVASIATRAFVKGGSQSEVPAQVKVAAYRLDIPMTERVRWSCMPNSFIELEITNADMRLAIADMHLKHISLAREMPLHPDIDARNKSKLRHLMGQCVLQADASSTLKCSTNVAISTRRCTIGK
ncbi:hypothetical protein Tco_1170820, partial [Tanacetum coccineum]